MLNAFPNIPGETQKLPLPPKPRGRSQSPAR